MGASGSIDANRIPEDIRKTYQLSEEVKEKIATYDARFLKIQASQAWKNHKLIISTLTERTKSQLQRVATIYTKSHEDGGHNKPLDEEIQGMLGGNYGEFMRLLVLKREQISSELLETALKSIGCDEPLLADVLCACSNHEMMEAQDYYNKSHKESLQSTIKSKTLEGSSFQKFIIKILSASRSDESVFDNGTAVEHMKEIHAAGVGREVGKDEDTIFSILCSSSRKHCELISEAYVKAHNMTLEAALTSKFAGSCARALILWIAPLYASIASLFHLSLNSTVVDFDHTCHLATKYLKSTLQEVLTVYERLYNENLLTKLGASLTGNFKKSVIAWLSSPTYDGGNESKIATMIEDCNGNLESLVEDSQKVEELRDLVEAEHNTVTQYLSEAEAKQGLSEKNKIPLLPTPSMRGVECLNSDKPATNTDEAPKDEGGAPVADITTSDQQVQAQKLEIDTPPTASDLDTEVAAVLSGSSKRDTMGEDDKFRLICEYLLERFKQDDIDDSGTLDVTEFASTLKHLNVGYTDTEIEAIQKWVDYDEDGTITYAEVVNELADSLIDVIQGQGMTVEDKIAQLWEENAAELERLWGEYEAWAAENVIHEENLSPSLVTYLKDSFDAFDVDKNGTLNMDEFWHILTTVLGLTDGDRALMENEWDDNNDGSISWEEALEEFNKIFRSKINDKRDHWIGLVDKATNNLFWFNLRDETSFWMNEEDQEKYRAVIANGKASEEVMAPAEIPSALSMKSTKSFRDNLKGLREYKSMRKRTSQE
mmetsp:Transcript_10387/g.15790  ORF Transcript_10387/g.15790 Transcript_10387/m.15790 type:complete len:770 (+) Transcript_10387:118-2427(+)